MACLYSDVFIQAAEGLPEDSAIPGELKLAWVEESARNIRELYAASREEVTCGESAERVCNRSGAH